MKMRAAVRRGDGQEVLMLRVVKTDESECIAPKQGLIALVVTDIPFPVPGRHGVSFSGNLCSDTDTRKHSLSPGLLILFLTCVSPGTI